MGKVIFQEQLNLFFRGERNYIYGPDLFDLAVQAMFRYFNVDTLLKLDFSSHDMTRSGLDVVLYTEAPDELTFHFHSKFTFTVKDVPYFGYLIANNKEVEKRIPYPENEIIDNCKLDKDSKSIVLITKTPFLITDNFTAMTKFLHYQAYPEITGKWIFTRVSYPEFSKSMAFDSLQVSVRKMFSNKFSQNLLFCDSNKVGTLYFALI